MGENVTLGFYKGYYYRPFENCVIYRSAGTKEVVKKKRYYLLRRTGTLRNIEPLHVGFDSLQDLIKYLDGED